MKQYLTKFSTRAAYEAELSNLDFPNVSYISGDDELVYTESEPSPTHDYSLDYFTIEAIDNDLDFGLGDPQMQTDTYYSFDDGNTWTSGTAFTMSAGDKVLIKSNDQLYQAEDTTGIIYETSGGRFNVYGNVMSLLFGDNFVGEDDLSEYGEAFFNLLAESGVVDASNLVLPATTLSNDCYGGMFWQCESLIAAPELPATTLSNGCYNGMFQGCSSLETAPELPAETLVQDCYRDMFGECTSLNYIKMLATDISAQSCIEYWVDGVSSTGTFVKDASMEDLEEGVSGIPTGWTVQDA